MTKGATHRVEIDRTAKIGCPAFLPEEFNENARQAQSCFRAAAEVDFHSGNIDVLQECLESLDSGLAFDLETERGDAFL